MSLLVTGLSPTGECGESCCSWQLLSLGCRTASSPNHDGAGAGAAADARQARPRPTADNPTGTAAKTPAATANAATTAAPKPQKARPRRPTDRLRTVHETSAGGLVIDGIDGPKDRQVAALIGRIDRRGRMLWSLPKGHIEMGETAEQTAIREVAEETGIQGSVLAALGSIDYWFVTEGRRVHKTVHHYLMRFLGGELSDEDLEVTEVAWVPLRGAAVPVGLRRRTPPRRGGRRTDRQAARRRARGPAAAAAHARRGVAARHTRTPAITGPIPPLNHSPAGGRTAADRGRDPLNRAPARRGRRTAAGCRTDRRADRRRRTAGVPAVPQRAHRQRHPRCRHHDQQPHGHRDRHGAQRRRPSGPGCGGAARTRPPRRRRRRRCAPIWPAMSTSTSRSPTSSRSRRK